MRTLREIDRELSSRSEELRNSYWDEQIQASRQAGAVLLVEGDDDKELVEEVLRSRRRVWENSVRVIAAGGRKQVLAARARFRAPFLLVDRDTWTDAEVQELRADIGDGGDLHVTDGWCLENIFFEPTVLRSIDSTVAAKVEGAREAWVRAGARWWILQRHREAAQLGWDVAFGDGRYGGLQAGVDPRSGAEFADIVSKRLPVELRTRLAVDIDALAAAFDERLRAVLGWATADQWQRGVHGKRAFAELLLPLLLRQLGPRADWKLALVHALPRPLPAPLDTLVGIFLP